MVTVPFSVNLLALLMRFNSACRSDAPSSPGPCRLSGSLFFAFKAEAQDAAEMSADGMHDLIGNHLDDVGQVLAFRGELDDRPAR